MIYNEVNLVNHNSGWRGLRVSFREFISWEAKEQKKAQNLHFGVGMCLIAQIKARSV